MIKVSFISPTSLIEEWGNRSDFHLALAHLIEEKENKYEREIKESNLPIYLDNGLFENGKSVPVEDLMEKAARLGAVYVFAPDVLYDREGTEANIDIAYEELQKANKRNKSNTKLAAVVQADNRDEYLASYLSMAANPKVELIGLSILSIPKSYEEILGAYAVSESRLYCLKEINALPLKKKSHLLGAGSSYIDVSYAAKNCSWVDSHDSSSAIWNGVQGHKLEDDYRLDKGKTKVPVNFSFDEELSGEQKKMIRHNIKTIQRLTE